MEVEDFELASPSQRDLNLLKKVKNKMTKKKRKIYILTYFVFHSFVICFILENYTDRIEFRKVLLFIFRLAWVDALDNVSQGRIYRCVDDAS